ncbi:MAG: glycosyltransferase family 1 protein [Acidobacteria bacterium]|nr:glycosyltransferase family 1 protein [Acidobacteriota bacterium]
MRIVCASIPGPGHAYPMLAVARALAERGHEVTLASGEEHERDAARAGASFARLPSTQGSPIHALRLYEDAAASAEAFLADLAALAPDAVVHDLITLGPALAAEVLAAPCATLVVHGLHTPSRDLPPFGWGHPPGRSPFGRWRDGWMRRGKLRDMTRARDDLNAARARLGLVPTERLDAQLSPDLVLVATLPSLELPRSDWPEAAHVVGPCLWEAEGDPIALPAGGAPLALVAASTAHDEGALLRAALAAVGALGLRAVVTAGKGAVPAALPPGVVAAPFAPHRPILSAAAVVVCNGGHGIVARSLSAGVPVLVVPGPGDQRENGYRVERAGAGLALRRPEPRAIARALCRMIEEPSFRARAADMRAEAARMDGPARAAELVESLASRRREKTGGGQVPAPLPNGGSLSTARPIPRAPGPSRRRRPGAA